MSDAQPEPELETETPFEAIGGDPKVRRIVERFYNLMDSDPAYVDLRLLHAADLAPMRASLAGFLTGWLGGPRTWFQANPGRCMMSMHATVPVSAATAAQWTHAMARSLKEAEIDPAMEKLINKAFANMARNMAGRD
ncbi:MAG: group II truncated hemoglobin [Alphaproteobacteria bacterium]